MHTPLRLPSNRFVVTKIYTLHHHPNSYAAARRRRSTRSNRQQTTINSYILLFLHHFMQPHAQPLREPAFAELDPPSQFATKGLCNRLIDEGTKKMIPVHTSATAKQRNKVITRWSEPEEI